MIHHFTLAYANKPTMERTLVRLRESDMDINQVHVLNNHYPLPSKSKWQEQFMSLALRFGFKVHNEGENLGQSDGYNYLMNKICSPGDYFTCMGLDSHPSLQDWWSPMAEIMDADESVVWCSVFNPKSFAEMQERGYKEMTIAGHKVYHITAPVINSNSCWRFDWVQSVGGFDDGSKYYGPLETRMFNQLNGNKWIMLADREEGNPQVTPMADAEYTDYKWNHAHKGYRGSFNEWLIDNGYGI